MYFGVVNVVLVLSWILLLKFKLVKGEVINVLLVLMGFVLVKIIELVFKEKRVLIVIVGELKVRLLGVEGLVLKFVWMVMDWFVWRIMLLLFKLVVIVSIEISFGLVSRLLVVLIIIFRGFNN